MKRPRRSEGALATLMTVAALLTTGGGDDGRFACAAAAAAPAAAEESEHQQQHQHQIGPRQYRPVSAHTRQTPPSNGDRERRYYPGPIWRSALSGSGGIADIGDDGPPDRSSIVMSSFEHRGLLRRLPSNSSNSKRRRRTEDLGQAGDASIASSEEIEPGTPGGWWERLYISGDYPEGRRGASAAVFQVLNANGDNGEGKRKVLSGESRPGPHTASHSGAWTSTAAADATRTPPAPGDPLPIPDHVSPSSSSRRPHWKPPNYDQIEREYMVVSGGFSDDDWSTFPVWAFDMSGDFQPAEVRGSYKWHNLGGESAVGETKGGPEARVGHMSAIHDGHLYVFGGLLYDHSNFFLENGLVVWKAYLLPPSDNVAGEEEVGEGGSLNWERIIPKIVDPSTDDVGDKPALAVDQDGRFEPIPSRPNEDKTGEDDGTAETNDPPHRRHHHRNLAAIPAKQPPTPYRLPRGEIQGGHWCPSNPGDDDSVPLSAFVFYGGLHVTHKTMPRKYTSNPLLQVDEPLGDVWMYDFDSNEFHRLAPYPPENWQTEKGLYPVARTAHGATVVGDKLIIYGGMKINTEVISYSGETNWTPLSDCWEFDLKERIWHQRMIEPQLARSYHSLVGWGPDGSIAAFGGYRSADSISGDAIAFVFSDVLVNRPDETVWMKAQWPRIYSARTITNRLEHVAVVDKEGSMFAWGGRFKTTSQVSGIWKIDIFNEDSTVIMAPAPPDGYDAFEAELEALHLLVAVMMFMSVIFTALYGSVRRQQMEMAAVMEGNEPIPGIMTLAGGNRTSGLSQEAIDAFPVKTYDRNRTIGANEDESNQQPDESKFVIDSEDDEADESGGRTLSSLEAPAAAGQGLEEEETCPICLLEYGDGDEIRVLSCGHEFHRDCVDGWLQGHASCPACRQTFSNRSSDLAEENYDPTWENLRRSVWGEAPAFLAPQTLSLAHIMAAREILFAEPPGENTSVTAGTAAAPQDVLGASEAESSTRESDEDVDNHDNFANDEHDMGSRGARRPRRLRIGRRVRGYRSVQPQATETEMVEIGTGSSSVV